MSIHHQTWHYFIMVLLAITAAACDTSEKLYWPEKEWLSASPESHGMDSLKLSPVIQEIKDGHFGYIRSLLVIKDGYIISENYFNNTDTSSLQCMYSVTKSLLGAVWGIAEENGDVPTVDTPIEQALPEYASLIQTDPLKRQITIHDLLTMTIGMDWEENDLPDGAVTNGFFELMSSTDPIAYTLSKSIIDTPGTVFNYNSGCSLLLSAIFSANCGKKFGEYVNEHLLSKIGIDSAYCEELLKFSNAASGLFLTPRDMARFGLLIARKGEWNGNQIVPSDWMQQATAPQVRLDYSPLFTGYGYQLWNTTQWLSVGIRDSITVHMALGWGGQMIVAVPNYDLVVVITASQSRDEHEAMDPIFIIWQYILPAIRPSPTT